MTPAPAFVLEPLPGETVHSWVSRYHFLSGDHRGVDTLRRCVGARHAVLATALPTRLGGLCESLGLPPRAAERVSEHHTALPYYRPFLSEAKRAQLARIMSGIEGGRLWMGLGLTRAGVRSPARPQCCPACVEADRKAYGVGYAHVAHQLPGVAVCYRHRDQWLVPLIDTGARHARHALYLPDDGVARRMPVGVEAPPACLGRFARLSHQLLTARLPTSVAHGWRETYRARLAQLGLTTRHGRLRQRDVHASLCSEYAALRSTPLFDGLRLDRHGESDWLAVLLRPHRSGKHPAKHLLVIGWLFDDLAHFLAYTPARTTPSPVMPKLPDPSRDNQTATDLLQRIETEGLTLTEVARRLGLSVMSVRVRAEALGVATPRRPKHLTPDKEEEIIGVLRRGLDVGDSAERTGVSLSTVYRILAAHADLKRLWLHRRLSRRRAQERRRVRRFRRARHFGSLSDYRARHPASYTWFYRHDFEWLRAQFAEPRARVPRRRLCDWEARDRRLAGAIRSVAQQALASQRKPHRLTQTALLRAVSSTATYEQYRHLLPATEATLAECTESVADAQRRRISWAAAELGRRGEPLTEWRIKRLAGLPKTLSPEVAAALARAARQAADVSHLPAPRTRVRTPGSSTQNAGHTG